eukprot:1125780-Rhodomonas_salina.6
MHTRQGLPASADAPAPLQLHGVDGPALGGGVSGRMSIDNEEEALNAAIMASMQDQVSPDAPTQVPACAPAC